jgi:hypothetical protein
MPVTLSSGLAFLLIIYAFLKVFYDYLALSHNYLICSSLFLFFEVLLPLQLLKGHCLVASNPRSIALQNRKEHQATSSQRA